MGELEQEACTPARMRFEVADVAVAVILPAYVGI